MGQREHAHRRFPAPPPLTCAASSYPSRARVGLSGASATGSYTRSGYYSTGGFADTPPLDTLTSGIRQTGFVLRGYEPGQFAGTNFALFNAEYRFPIAYVDRGLSTLPGFLRTLSGTLFLDWGGTYDVLDLERPYDAFHVGVGGELWIDFLLEYVTGGELRLGVAKGLDSEARKRLQVYFVAASSLSSLSLSIWGCDGTALCGRWGRRTKNRADLLYPAPLSRAGN